MNSLTRIGSEVFDSRDVIEALNDVESGELAEDLKELQEWGEENVTDWQYGETLIREDYFAEYARELAEGCGAFHVPASPYGGEPVDIRDNWPFRHIDWEAAAEELKADYVDVEFQGRTYYVRSV